MDNNFGKNLKNNNRSFKKDIFVLILSIAAAFLIALSGIVNDFLLLTQKIHFLSSFLAGLFFVSIFTAAPALVVLLTLFAQAPLLEVSLFAAIGGVVGDFLIFKFFGSLRRLHFEALFKNPNAKRLSFLFKSGLAWIVPVIGAIVIASPLPDEIGLALLGFSRFPTALLIPLSLILNFIGIFIFGLIVRQI